MAIPQKKNSKHVFIDGMDSDTSPEYLSNTKARYMLNCRYFSFGNLGVITNVKGTTLITTPLPSGNNRTIGSYPDEANNRFFFFVYNDTSLHTIFLYNDITNQVISVFQSVTQSNGIDILKFSPNYLILHTDIIAGNLIYWTDGLNKARKFNISKMMDQSVNGYGFAIYEDYITAYKQTAIFAPVPYYITDTSRNTNNLYANLFKFTVRWHYDDGELSNWCDWSVVPLPSSQSYLGIAGITNTNNAIALPVPTGSSLVKKIEIAVKVNNNQINAVGEIQITDFVVCQLLNKDELSIPDLSTYIWNFYNDGSYSNTDQNKINRLYSYLPRVPKCQAFVRNAMTYTNFEEGFDSVLVDASVACTFTDLFIPAGTVNQLNNPSITVTLVSVNKEKQQLFVVVRYNPTYRFTIGFDVKKGNVYNIYGTNGGSTTSNEILDPLNISGSAGDKDNYFFTYTANGNDTAETVAAQIKQFLRSIGRGYPSNPNAISNEGTDGSGTVHWDYGYLGKWKSSQTVFSGSVTPVSFESLKDDGTSFNLVKYGTVRNYGFVYVDDDGRESLAYTSPTSVVRTPFITEIGLNTNGDFQRPVHTITINHQPPLWAKYWKLVRTPDTASFIWTLIQQVIEQDPGTIGDGEYLDLAIGSLPTYNKLHPNSILTYEFTRGDRLRPVLDTATGNLYNQYYDTEILSYSTETTELVNSNITVNGSTIVTPTKPVRLDQAGFNIQINGNERLIVTVDTGANTYALDEPIVGDNTSSPTTVVTYPNFVLIDRRGTIRIAKPTGITILPNSIVEIYTPQAAAISTDYKIFYDFGQKFEIINWGTANAYHAANVQNQSAIAPALMSVINGDAYIRNREYPTNTIFPGTQVTVNKAVDPNFSDFYFSDMHDTGRVYPQDLGLGKKLFGSRVRYSNNYIQDTSVNGLNDFDSASREDYDDPYGVIQLTKFREARLYAFKELKSGYILVNNQLTTGADGNTLLASTEKLLNQMQYFAWEGGIGNNPESWTSNGNYMYLASANSGVFLRIAGDGSDAISSIYFFDKACRALLAIVQQYGLQLLSGFDRENDEALWTILPYIEVLFNGGFNSNIWSTVQDINPNNSTGIVVTQPVNGNVVYNGITGNFEITMNPTFVGTDSFTYKLQLPDSSFTTIKNECITVSYPAIRQKGYKMRDSSAYCLQIPFVPPIPPTSTISINNTTTDFNIAFVKVFKGATLVYSRTNILAGTSVSGTIASGTGYSVNVKILPSTDGGVGVLRVDSNGTITPYTVSNMGLTITQTGVQTPIIVELDPT
jgi:hypothetical protein